jgi:diguanylate cyclase (GGDEF)-like protein
MASRYGALTFYSWTLAIASVAWLFIEAMAVAFPPLWVSGLCIAACLFVFQFGIRAPRVGLISMERVPQIGLLLVLGAPVAATICAVASLLWPLINRRYSQGSSKVALLRGVHNAGMTALMLLVAGKLYDSLDGQLPLRALSMDDVWPLLAIAAAIQVINISLMTLFYRFDGREVKQIITPSYALSDLIFVPAGVLAALLFNAAVPATFALFIVLMAVFVLSFNAIGQSYASAALSRGPLARVFQARRALHGARSIDTLGERVVTETRSLLRFDEFYLALVDRDKRRLDIRVHEHNELRLPASAADLDAGILGQVVAQGQSVLVVDNSKGQPAAATNLSVIAVPLLDGDVVVGVLSVEHSKAGVYSQADVHLLERLAEEVAVAVADARAFEDAEEYRQRLEQRVAVRSEDLERANRENMRLIVALREHSQMLERESQEDALTGLANRRAFMQRLAAEIEVAKAMGQPLTLAIADLDLFKAVNDLLGHRVGDEVLRHSASLMKDLCKSTDLLGRIGGEEFALLLPSTACDAAIKQCEAMRNAIEAHEWQSIHPELRVTISIGLWQWDGNATVSELLHAADTQLYEAKRNGRNRVARFIA